MVVVNSKNVTEISVCVDCCLLFETGEVHDADGNDITADVAGGVMSNWGEASGRIVMSSDDEPGFSWSKCEGCGSTLGGDRMKAVVLPA